MQDAAPDFDLDAYLRRIAYGDGPRGDGLDTLAALHRAHVAAVPFENLDPLLGRPVALDAAALQAKLVRQRRGGWCYEHNLLFGRALRALGFEVRDLAARVRWNVPPEVRRPRTHMLLLVHAAGRRWIADAGFGGLTLTAPLDLDLNDAQAAGHGRFKLSLLSDGDHELQAETGGQWRPLYAFGLQPQQLADYEMASWYLCRHPASIFTRSLMAARALPSGRLSLLDGRFTRHGLDGGTPQVRQLGSAGELRGVLEGDFGIDLTGLADVDELLERVVAKAA